jgi:hypothetical protein
MNKVTQHSLAWLRACGLAALCVLLMNGPSTAVAQTTNSTNGATQPNAPATSTPGNSPLTLVQPGTSGDKNSAKRNDNGKNDK